MKKSLACIKRRLNHGGKTVRAQRSLSLGDYMKAVSWSKYLVSSGGEIREGGEEEWSADVSQLLIGNKFAAGRHSRIYHGIYREGEVAAKLISQPEEDATLAAHLEQQFNSEAALLLRLRHPNIITVVMEGFVRMRRKKMSSIPSGGVISPRLS